MSGANSATLSAGKENAHWRRFTRHPSLGEYQRLFALLGLTNIGIFFWGLDQATWFHADQFRLEPIANLVLINFTVAILFRQQRLINGLFWIATRIPTHWPLWIRWGAGKVFHFGGLHSGGATFGTLWFGALLYGMGYNAYHQVGQTSAATIAVTAVMLLLLLTMLATALPGFRARHHNSFELVHRIVGWTVLLLFWVQNTLVSVDAGGNFVGGPAFWALLLVTLSVVSPWLTLKKVPIEVIKPSNHAVDIRFDYGDTPFPGSSNAISLSPLREWHSFANIPTPGKDGYRLIVSRAGDWTGRFIDNPPSHVWVKGITTAGVANIELLFKKVVYVGTGSGIGPILPHLLAQYVPCKLIWSTRSPRETYGADLVDEIVQASPDALIWDTDTRGKPDLSELAERAVRESGAEAVICISNQKLTRKVVHDMESLGIPAYGAIWDS